MWHIIYFPASSLCAEKIIIVVLRVTLERQATVSESGSEGATRPRLSIVNSVERICLPEFPRRRKEIFRIRDRVHSRARSMLSRSRRSVRDGECFSPSRAVAAPFPLAESMSRSKTVRETRTASKFRESFARRRTRDSSRESSYESRNLAFAVIKCDINFSSGSSICFLATPFYIHSNALLFTFDQKSGGFPRERFIRRKVDHHRSRHSRDISKIGP